MSTTDDYVALITNEHRDKQNFVATMRALTQGPSDVQNLLAALNLKFDLDQAIGVQLDQVGVWAGITRQVAVPLTGVYFAFDTVGVGFDQGSWQGPFDPSVGLVNLDDANYRVVIKAKVAANHWDGTLPDFLKIMALVFAGTPTLIFATDNQDMSMTVGLAGHLPSAVLISLLHGGYLVPKPEGVRLNYISTSLDGSPIFGFDLNNGYIAGFDQGAWGV